MNRKSIINIAFAVLGVLSLAFFIFNAVIIAVQYGSIDQEDTALLLGTGICPMIICAAAIIASHKSRSLLPDLPIMILSDAAFFFLSRNRYDDEIAEGYVFLPIFLFSLIHLFLQSRKFNTTILFLSIGFYCILTFFISLIMPLLGVICIILASGCFSRLFGKIGDSFDSMRSEKRLLPCARRLTGSPNKTVKSRARLNCALTESS